MMRTLLVSILFLAQAAFGTSMGQGYSSYYNATADETDIYLTTTTEGATTVCGLCLGAKHQAKSYAQIGGVSQTVYSPYVTPPTYISLQAAVTLTNPLDNQPYVSVTQSKVTCTIAGTVIFVTFTFDLSLRKLRGHIQYQGPVPTDIVEGNGSYKFSPVAPECSNTTTPAVQPNYVDDDNAYFVAWDVVVTCPDILGLKWCIYGIPGGGVGPPNAGVVKSYLVDPGPGYCDPGP